MHGKPRWCSNVLFLLLSLITLPPYPATATAAEPKAMSKPDFSAVTDRIKAGALVRQGKLVKILLFPAELGGSNSRENIGYITSEAAEALSLTIGTLKRFTAEGLIDNLTVQPEYRAASIVPTRIVLHATHHSKKGGFDPTIEIW